ncbi:MAG: NifU family protein [Chlorobi bacterium]|nr:NifU family protein [Chlorobiota bacterium]
MAANEQVKLKLALDEIRPFLRKDGGDVRVVRREGKKLYVQFLGNCMHCKIKGMTLTNGIKYIVNKYLPEIEVIEEI